MNSEIMAVVALFISAISLYISVREFYLSRPAAVLREEQNAAIRIVATNAYVLWIQLQTVLDSINREYTMDPYLHKSMVLNAQD